MARPDISAEDVARDGSAQPASPRFSPEDLAAFAREVHGVEGQVQTLPSYADQNALVREPGGRAWVLKVANAAEDAALIELQAEVLKRVQTAEPGIAPQLRPTLEGGVSSHRRGHHVWMVSFLEGCLLEDAEKIGPGTWRSLGDLLARVDRAIEGVEHPLLTREMRWDLSQSAWTLEHTDLFSGARRALVERAQLQFLSDSLRVVQRLPRTLIHNDANRRNLVVSEEGGEAEVVGLFDFGDVVQAPRIFELAVAGAYAVFDTEDPVGVLEALLDGYCARQPLEDLERRALTSAAAMRLVTSVTGSALGARNDPDNTYVQIDEERAWRALERLVDLPPSLTAPGGLALEEVRDLRSRHLGPSLSLSYQEPLQIERGRGTYLFDKAGRSHLDCVNNVCHVGHCHPRVVSAATEQIAALNTNTRYLHDHAPRYAARLAALLPGPLEVCYFVNSGSEANELALRMARAHTKRHDMAVVRWGYHGHTSSLIDLSSYKHDGPGGAGAPDWVHVAPCPDAYREPECATADARAVSDTLDRAGRDVAGFLVEPLIGCGGQIVPPEGWLAAAFAHARERGAVCIADEVQVGFGRVGSHWWAFEEQGATPDIVTLGKPIGNGHPMAVVVTTRAIAETFDNGMEFFSTFGGNPVSCAVGNAVLDVIEDEDLRGNARTVGAYLLAEMKALMEVDEGIGDVRGRGLYLGLELVKDRATKEPDAARLNAVIERCRSAGVLLSSDGPHHNVLKVKPPLAFRRHDAALLLSVLSHALAETPQ